MTGFSIGRHVDIVDGNGVLHEVTSGYVLLHSSISRQIHKDALLQANGEQVVWHFVASGRSGSMGVDPGFLALHVADTP